MEIIYLVIGHNGGYVLRGYKNIDKAQEYVDKLEKEQGKPVAYVDSVIVYE